MSRLFALSGLFNDDLSQLSAKEQRDLLTELRLRRELRQERLRRIGLVVQLVILAGILIAGFIQIHFIR